MFEYVIFFEYPPTDRGRLLAVKIMFTKFKLFNGHLMNEMTETD